MSEQELITKIQTDDCDDSDIQNAIQNYPTSVVLNYLIGEYYHKKNNDVWKYHMHKCITLNKLFSFAYYKLCEASTPHEVISLLTPIFNKRTIDYDGKIKYMLNTQIRILSLLAPAYIKIGDKKNARKSLLVIHDKLLEMKRNNTPHDITQEGGWANICNSLASLSVDKKIQYDYYLKGINGIMDDKQLYGAALTSHYIGLDTSALQKLIKKTFNSDEPHAEETQINKKPRIGYLSPDFNKNAVGLFSLPLIKNASKFDVYCYYTNSNEDEFTQYFKNDNWHNVGDMADYEIYQLMKSHNIDILVDLLPFKMHTLINMRPASVIINYLGFPDVTYINSYTHRIVDKITDPYESKAETFIHLDRAFMCFNMFPNIKVSFYEKPHGNKVFIGIFNRIDKHSDVVKKLWKKILSIKKNYILVFKSGDKDDYSEYPKNQVVVLPFAEKLETYLEYYNQVDFCIDTFPYSGTTTTCSALYMGVPTYTLCGKTHVSRVSTSIMTHLKLEDYVCDTEQAYIKKIINHKPYSKAHVRETFLNYMNPETFMQEYEGKLTKIILENC